MKKRVGLLTGGGDAPGLNGEATRMVIDNSWNQAVVYRDGKIMRAPISD